MRRRDDVGAAVEIVLQRVARTDRDARRGRSLPRPDRRDVDLGELVAHAFVFGRGIAAVERLEAAGDEAGNRQNDAEPRDGAAFRCVQATTLTILCGTTITFFGALPSRARCDRIERPARPPQYRRCRHRVQRSRPPVSCR